MAKVTQKILYLIPHTYNYGAMRKRIKPAEGQLTFALGETLEQRFSDVPAVQRGAVIQIERERQWLLKVIAGLTGGGIRLRETHDPKKAYAKAWEIYGNQNKYSTAELHDFLDEIGLRFDNGQGSGFERYGFFNVRTGQKRLNSLENEENN